MKRAIPAVVIAGLLFAGCTAQPHTSVTPNVGALLIFHNNSGPMCRDALEWLERMKLEHAGLVVEEHLTYETGTAELLAELKEPFEASQGVSTSFEYLPIVFLKGEAFSGFNDAIADTLETLLSSAGKGSV